jgi:hypothetical protein
VGKVNYDLSEEAAAVQYEGRKDLLEMNRPKLPTEPVDVIEAQVKKNKGTKTAGRERYYAEQIAKRRKAPKTPYTDNPAELFKGRKRKRGL